MDNFPELVFLFIVALVGSFSNTIVGGGWFIIFPGLIYRGIPPVLSNATTMLSLWAGHLQGANAADNSSGMYPRNLKYLILSCGSGGLIGALLVVVMPHRVFEHIGPLLLLGSFVLFVCYRQILNYVVSGISTSKKYNYSHSMLIPLFFLGIYGGYFGAGMGMIIFILYRSYGIKDTVLLERLAWLLVTVNTGVALIVYTISGLIFWPFVVALIAGSILGARLGALVETKVNRAVIKKIMVAIGAIVTLYFVSLLI